MKSLWEGAAILLVAAAVTLVAGAWIAQSDKDGTPPTIDFVHFYTIGYAAAQPGQRDALVSDAAWRKLIARIAPGRDQYPRIYGPQVALAFAPLSYFPLFPAYIVWNLISLAAFVVSIRWILRRHAASLMRHHFLVTAAVLGFPSLTYVLVVGHASVVAVVALVIATHGLARRSFWIAGLGFGILAFKPTLLLPALAVLVVAGEWRVTAVATGVAVTSLLATIPVLGVAPVQAYISALLALGRTPDAVANPLLMCSLRTLWQILLPPAAALVLYILSAGATVLTAAWGFRRTSDPLQRVALISLAVALATPHLYYYDLVLVAPALIASAAWIVNAGPGTSRLRATTAAAYFAPLLAPIVLLVPVHVPALINGAWFATMLWAWAGRGRDRGLDARVPLGPSPRPASPL